MTAVRRAVLSLGSNLGDRMSLLQSAVDELSAVGRVAAVSPVFETDPVGGPEQSDFLNAVTLVDTQLGAHDLLAAVHDIEARHARVRGERWGPRTLDIDVIAVAAEEVDDEDLRVPHPRATERAFVLVPWLAVDAEAVLPDGRRVADLLAGLDQTGVRRRGDLILQVPPGGST